MDKNNVRAGFYAYLKVHKAITLVALIITVIILLILAGVTISIALGENGIFSQSKLAVQKYENARIKEEKELQDVSNLISNLGIASNRDETKSNEEKIAELEAKVNSLTALISENGGINPPGTIIAYMAGTTAPKGYLPCDGSVYNISQYPNLANEIKKGFGNANKYGGDGIDTFGVPNLQGEFLRGTGQNANSGQGNGDEVGAHQDSTSFNDYWVTTSDFGILGTADPTANTDTRASASIGMYYSSGKTLSATSARIPYGRFTARPTNTSVLYCIKY